MISTDWAVVIYAMCVPLLISIYILEIIAIFTNRKKFNSTFYSAFAVLSIVDVLACLVGTFLFRLPLYPIFGGLYSSMIGDRTWLPPLHTLAYYLNCLSQVLGVLMAFQRFTAVLLPQYHIQLWRRGLFLGFIFSTLVSVSPVFFLLSYPIKFVNRTKTISFYVLVAGNGREGQIWFNMTMVTAGCNVISSLLYVACLVRLCIFSKTRNSTVERNFFIVGFTSMMFSLPYMAAMACHLSSSSCFTRLILISYIRRLTIQMFLNLNWNRAMNLDTMYFMIFQLPWLTDLKYLSAAPMLLLTNKAICTAIKTILSAGKTTVANSITSKVLPTSNPKIITVK